MSATVGDLLALGLAVGVVEDACCPEPEWS
jgi:nicotinamidase-related amidase